MNTVSAILALEDGHIWHGQSVGAPGDAIGELVFNTAMTGYQEMLTDPSYMKQIITLTAAHVGNTGCNDVDWESSRVWAAGLVIRDASFVASNYRSQYGFTEWLKKQGVVTIAGLDTRDITRYLREHGSMNACISTDVSHPEAAIAKARACQSLANLDLATPASRKTIERWYEGEGDFAKNARSFTHHIVVFDYGVKRSILRILYDLGCHITIVPAHTSVKEVLALNPDGIVLSNGPGDPKACDFAIETARALVERDIPVLGICLGFQILGLALGAKSCKMKFGHHGANHPVVEVSGAKRVYITSQNHGFAIDEAGLPSCLMVTHRSAFDGSLQGFRHKTKSVWGVQGHPEASPGPHDMVSIFDDFLAAMK